MSSRSLPRVALIGADNVGWALDEELRLLRVALEGVAELTDIQASEVVLSTWWQAVTARPVQRLAGKRVVAYVAEDVLKMLESARSIAAREIVGCWLSCSPRESAILESLSLRHAYVPFIVDPETFRPLDESRAELRGRYGLPLDAYLVGSFQRDTEGHDLRSPKLVKGPDVFAEALRLLRARGLPIHAVLAGPRRFWLRRRLEELDVPFTYVGTDVAGDDVTENTLARSVLNELYNAIDLYFVSSRSEGVGPQAILEAAAAGCAIVSTRAGIASHTLEPVSVVDAAVDAADRIERDITGGTLAAAAPAQRQRVLQRHSPSGVAEPLRALCTTIAEIPVFTPRPSASVFALRPAPRWRRALDRIARRGRRPRTTVALWHEFHAPPYGGGNQFFLALRKALRQRGARVVENTTRADVHLLQSIWFDEKRLRRDIAPGALTAVHRIGSVIELARGTDRADDERVLRLNHEYASATAVVSAWCYTQLMERGHRPKNAVIIPNAVDSGIFHPRGRTPFDRTRRTRLIATSWSDNPRKGGATYRWMDEHLDWERYEFTFVGRTKERFERIRVLDPVDSEQLAGILRQHDIYVTASQHEACSNALIEAQACGLPALYLNDGGNPEIVGFGGLPFTIAEDIPAQLERLISDYETFASLIAVRTMDEVAGKYLDLFEEIR